MTDDKIQLNLPPTWYVFGDAVLDAICGETRAEYLAVATPTVELTPLEVRRALKPHAALNVAISAAPHRVICTLDSIVLTPDGRFFDVLLGSYVAKPSWPVRLAPFTPDLSARDVIRLHYVLNGYPEIEIDAKFHEKIVADLAFFEEYRGKFPDLATRFIEYEPYSRWRVR